MDLMQFHRRRVAIQENAPAGRARVLRQVEVNLREVLSASGLFERVEVEHTNDPDRLVIALCAFRPEFSEEDIAFRLENLWSDRVRYQFWEAHAVSTDDDHVELEAASRSGPAGPYVTVHLVAQKARIPLQRPPSR